MKYFSENDDHGAIQRKLQHNPERLIFILYSRIQVISILLSYFFKFTLIFCVYKYQVLQGAKNEDLKVNVMLMDVIAE